MAAGDLVTEQWHAEWRGMLIGYPLTAATFSNLTGWLDLPDMRTANAERPARHGAWPGQQRLGARTVELSIDLADADDTFLTRLRAATTPDLDPQEEALVIWAGTVAPQLVYARVERRAIPTDHAFSVGHHRATIQWVATDPHRYGLTEQTASVGLLAPATGGLVFPAEFPLDFGTGQSGGTLSVTNTGTAVAWPTLTIDGPVTGPVITNVTTGQQLLFDPTWEIPAGQQVVINTDARTVHLEGVGRDDKLRTRQWFGLPSGVATQLQFTSAGAYDPGALLTVAWRDPDL